jgi:hypothetical protein
MPSSLKKKKAFVLLMMLLDNDEHKNVKRKMLDVHLYFVATISLP